jgi:hypothetical protein
VTNRKTAGAAVRKGDYGPVLVTKGSFKARVGYYDDDNEGFAVVYFGRPFDSPYELIRRQYLTKTMVLPLELERWIRENPDLAHAIGVKRSREGED